MKRIYLVRHGESEANVARVHGGHRHPLTERGRQQAEFIAERCKNLPLEALFASTMVRAQETGQTIAERTGLTLKTMEDIHEVGVPSAALDKNFDDPGVAEAIQNAMEHLAPGKRHSDEESFDELMARAQKALDFWAAQDEGHIGVVSHGLFIRCILARAVFGENINSRELLALWRGLKSENTGLTILEYRPDTPGALWRVFVWNDHAHLG